MDRRHRSRSPLSHRGLDTYTVAYGAWSGSSSVQRSSGQDRHSHGSRREWNDRGQPGRLDDLEHVRIRQISRDNPYYGYMYVRNRSTYSRDQHFKNGPFRGPLSSQCRDDYRSRSPHWELESHQSGRRKRYSPDRQSSVGKQSQEGNLERESRRLGRYFHTGNTTRGSPERQSIRIEPSVRCDIDVIDMKTNISVSIGDSVNSVLHGVINQENTIANPPASTDGEKDSATATNNKSEGDINQNENRHTFICNPILPNVQDIGRESKAPKLDKNIVKGSYKDPLHYLDTQFGLLREDLIGPLRSSIQQYTSRASKGRSWEISKLDDGYCYTGVRLHDIVPCSRGIGYRIMFDVRLLRRTRWLKVNSKRLLQGNLVCLSADNFNTFICAAVEERNPGDLARGELVVLLLSAEFQMLDRSKVWVMIEAISYYEAYRHVLARLQDLGVSLESGMKLPFERQLVFCEPSQVPGYLNDTNVDFHVLDSKMPGNDHERSLQGCTLIDLTGSRPLAMPSFLELHESTKKEPSLIFNPQETENWESLKCICLDGSQIAALQNIMTNELSVIQGPPGTGKSFIGLCFVRVLLANKRIWKKSFGDNIMIVCYTNHALDQFLEGVVESGSKASMVRIGGGSKSETLKPYMIWNQRKQTVFPKHQRRAIYYLKNEITHLNFRLKQYAAISKLRPAEFAIWELESSKSIPDIQAQDLLKSGDDLAPAIVVWLAGADLQHAHSGKYRRVIEEAYTFDNTNTQACSTSNLEDNYGAAKTDGNALRDELFLCEEDIRQLQSERDMGEDDWLAEHMTESHESVYGKSRIILPPSSVSWLLNHTGPMPEETANTITDVWALPGHIRCSLYLRWCFIAMEKKNIEAKNIFKELQVLYKKLDEYHHKNDLMVVKGSEIIGLTTTGAAKYHKLIQKVKPRIVIVEEAAEVLEAHIVTALTEKCEHLVLIGDHKQLRPKPTMYKLARDYNMDISLFERMVRNNMAVSTLEFQHRMRPEISQFLVPHIYSQLRDHEVVKSYDHVRGVSGDVIFLNHSVNEAQQDDSHSHTNRHEAELAVGLCEYLLKQEYEPSHISVMAMYTGQMIQIRRLLYSADIKDIRVSAVDSFQGEENDIVILSCVRSNKAGKIGFLKAPNRICVSLSRARMGFYAVGNFTMYSENSKVWKSIIDDVKNKGLLKNHITLHCFKHDKKTDIESADDFKKVPFGGCSEPCYFKLHCGHLCYRVCHVDDAEHKKYRCKKLCERKCEKGHKTCRRKCMDNCSACDATITVTKPGCGHVYKVKCSREDDPCTKRVEKLLDCGHKETFQCSRMEKDVLRYKCRKHCHRKCTNNHITYSCKRKCFETCSPCCENVFVQKEKCGHGFMTECFKVDHPCPQPVERVLDCGHVYISPCGSPCVSRCEMPVQVERPCGHSSIMPCWMRTLPLLSCDKPCTKKLSCGHGCRAACGRPCTDGEPCSISEPAPLPCGHIANVPCSMVHKVSSDLCRNSVLKTLPCGHVKSFACIEVRAGKDKTWRCPIIVAKKLQCGLHSKKVKCSEDTADIICDGRKTVRQLPCGHFEMVKCFEDLTKIKCLAFTVNKLPCGHKKTLECYLDQETVTCDKRVEKELPCGHKMEVLCGEDTAVVTCTRQCNRDDDIKVDETHRSDVDESGMEG